jgi:hypothetical protein
LGTWYRVHGVGYRVLGIWYRVVGIGYMVQGIGVQGFCSKVYIFGIYRCDGKV